LTESLDAVAQFTATTNAAVAQARTLASDTVAQIDAGTFGCEAWGRSMIKLFDIMARGSATHFKTAIAHNCCPAAPSQDVYPCGMQPVEISVAADNNYSRQLSIQQQFTQVGGSESIPNAKIPFLSNVLAAGATSFSMRLLDAYYMGRSYTATIRLTTMTSNFTAASSTDEVVTVTL
jgi:hypothetical protein